MRLNTNMVYNIKLYWVKDNARPTQMIGKVIHKGTFYLEMRYIRVILALPSYLFVCPCIFHYQRIVDSWWNMS